VILPPVVIRRLDCVQDPTQESVLKKASTTKAIPDYDEAAGL